jgi:hypothetical protein
MVGFDERNLPLSASFPHGVLGISIRLYFIPNIIFPVEK